MGKGTRWALVIGLAWTAFVVGRWSARSGEVAEGAAPSLGDASVSETLWTCPMHPQVRLPEFGPCPICEMDLVPLEASPAGGGAPETLTLSAAARELARIETQPVARRALTREVRMVGKIDYDETALRTISAWVPGRLERLFVDYTGVRVEAGDHLVRLYSPELLAAQEELLSARGRLDAIAAGAAARGGAAGATDAPFLESSFMTRSTAGAYEAAREKLLLWGLTEEQVTQVEERGIAEDSVELTSPASGVVIEKPLREGAYVQTGTAIYRIADLSRLWVRLDAYEQDLAWLRYGQEVSVRAEAFPGEQFSGRISFIDPMIDEATRTVKVRVNINNSERRLKPGMFVRASVMADIGAHGLVLDRSLAGKWISPMHPEVVKDAPGDCDVCGMDLVPAEELGVVPVESGDELAPLVVPASAVLLTGRRGIVYVELPDASEPTFEAREVELGPRGVDHYVVLAGLAEGERVVVQGAFRLDSSMQILARPSFMTLPAELGANSASGKRPAAGGSAVPANLNGAGDVLRAYLELQQALAGDNVAAARAAGEGLARVAAEFGAEASEPAWHDLLERIGAEWGAEADGRSLDELRARMPALGALALELVELSGNPLDEPLLLAHCPMALDGDGAHWLQLGEVLSNPYFGAQMLRCGAVERRVAAGSSR